MKFDPSQMKQLRALKPASRFRIGERVHVVGGWRYATVTAVSAIGKTFRYRLVGSESHFFESDLELPA